MQGSSYGIGSAGGNKEVLDGSLTILEPEETPYVSMVSKGPGAGGVLSEVMSDTLRAAKISGSKEGQAQGKGNNKALKRKRFGNYAHRTMDEFGVTDVQQLVTEKGGNAATNDEYGDAKAKCVREVKRDIEAACCSNNETQGGSEDEMLTRGVRKWLSTTAQATQPVPADFRPTSATQLSGVGTSVPLFTEVQFNTLLKGLQRVYGGKRSYDVIAGDNVVDTIDQFTRVQPSSTNQRYYVTENASKHTITMMVQVFESSFGKANIIPTQFNSCDADGVCDPQVAYVLNMALWSLDFMEALHAGPDQEDAGGINGYVKAIYHNMCKNPKGNGLIYNT